MLEFRCNVYLNPIHNHPQSTSKSRAAPLLYSWLIHLLVFPPSLSVQYLWRTKANSTRCRLHLCVLSQVTEIQLFCASLYFIEFSGLLYSLKIHKVKKESITFDFMSKYQSFNILVALVISKSHQSDFSVYHNLIKIWNILLAATVDNFIIYYTAILSLNVVSRA